MSDTHDNVVFKRDAQVGTSHQAPPKLFHNPMDNNRYAKALNSEGLLLLIGGLMITACQITLWGTHLYAM